MQVLYRVTQKKRNPILIILNTRVPFFLYITVISCCFTSSKTKEKQRNTLIVACCVVNKRNFHNLFDILNSNETQNNSGEAVSAIHKMFKIILKSRCLQKSKIVDWRLRVGVGGGQACCIWGPGHPYAPTLLLLITVFLTSRKPAN